MSENKDLEMELEDVIVLEDEDGNEIEFELGDKLVYEGIWDAPAKSALVSSFPTSPT